MGVSIAPWDLAKRAECWGQMAIDYVQANHDAAVMREQIAAVRAKQT